MSKLNNLSKVFCIGFHKTGTSTIGDALLELNYKVIGARLDLAKSLLEGNTEPALLLAQKYNAFQDVPWALLYKEMDVAFPSSKFILTIRDEEKWINSIKTHFGSTYTDMRKWIYGTGVAEGNEAIYLERYRLHNREVKEYFKNRPDDLLIMSFEDGDAWGKLCAFLGTPVPQKKFPYSNKGKHNYNYYDKSYNMLRSMVPQSIRKWHINLLIKLGKPDKRNRFHNKEQNQNYKEKLRPRNS